MACFHSLRSALLAVACLQLAAPAEVAHAQTAQNRGSAIAKEIFDPGTSVHWFLVRNPDHPGGPGKLVMADSRDPVLAPWNGGSLSAVASRPIVIRANDSVLLEEHTPSVDLCLEALALGPAIAGQTFLVRLKTGGHIARAIAVAHGHAAFAPQAETKR